MKPDTTIHTESDKVDTPIDKTAHDEALQIFPRAYHSLRLSARLKARPEDFIVDEIIDIDMSGEGEHCWLYIRKRRCNTEWIAKRIARFCDIPVSRVSYAGLKDRHAVTSQWFSVHLPGKATPDWQSFEQAFNAESINDESIQVLQQYRHNRKLQRGALKANRFSITLREFEGCAENRGCDDIFSALDERCTLIAEQGVPNYFGEQRFGHGRQNIQMAREMFSGMASGRRRKLPRHKRSLYLSAARSWLFNLVLSKRVEDGNWNKRLAGDVFMLDGRSACFTDDGSEALETRLASHDIHPALVLWGEGEDMVGGTAREMEMAIIDSEPLLRDGLIAARVKAARRASMLVPADMGAQREGDDYVLRFTLPAGAYATTVLGEMVTLKD